jgi:hypothetical protein
MAQFDPLYGELLTSREVSEMSGLTLNQLRNYRLPDRQDKMPFGFIRIGGTSLYRKAVIEAWLEENGVAQPEYIQADIDRKIPLNNVLAVDNAKRDILNRLKTITTENATGSMGNFVTGSNGLPNAMTVIQNEGRRMLAIERGIEDWKSFGTPNTTMQANDPEGYWKIMTWGVRMAYALAGKLDVTDEDIMSIPVGDVPPLKIK